MRPETSAPWRKTLRAEARGQSRGRRHPRSPEPNPVRRGSTWLRRHSWLPNAFEVYCALPIAPRPERYVYGAKTRPGVTT